MSEKHSAMKMGGSGSEKPMPTPEQQNVLEVKKVTLEEFPKLVRQIRSLARNALDTLEGTGLSEREDDVTGLDHEYLESAKRGELYVGMKNDVVVAFVALKKTSDESGKKAVIDQVRYAAGLHKPERIVAGVLQHIKSSLDQKGIHHTDIESEGHHNLESVEGTEWFQKMFNIADSNEDGEPESEVDLDAHI